MYRVAYKRSFPADKSDLSRQWIGYWSSSYDNDAHTGHNLPISPITFPSLKHKFNDYQRVEAAAKLLRASSVKYNTARIQLKTVGTDFLMTRKEYYNLAGKMFKDIPSDDIPEALCAVFDNSDWKYAFREKVTADGKSRQILQIFFWNNAPHIREFARRFTSNALLVVDCTFRTNRRGLPLMIAMAKSNTNTSFPIAFSWVPEEDAESYAFFYETLRAELYRDIPEPAVVLTDLSSGMIRAYDILKCLPHSQLQYCQWHAIEAIQRHLRSCGRYTDDQVSQLRALAKIYVESQDLDELEVNRQAFLDELQADERDYIRKNWEKREHRLISCHVKFFTNLGARTTQMSEGYNTLVHTICHHQQTLEKAAGELIAFVNDRFRDFEAEVERAENENLPNIPKLAFKPLVGSITLQALAMVKEQWKLLYNTNRTAECTGHFHSQYLLPCSHDLQRAYESGEPLPRSLVHPRYYVHGNTSTTVDWLPSYGEEEELQPEVSRNLAIEIDRLLDARNMLQGDKQRSFDRLIFDTVDRLVKVANSQHTIASLPLLLPVDRHAPSTAIPTANEAFIIRRRREQRAKAKELKNERILAQQAKAKEMDILSDDLQQLDTQASMHSHITVRPRSQIHELSSSSSSSSDDDYDQPLIEQSRPQSVPAPQEPLPPASTAPPAMTGRTIRKRAGTGFYKILLDGDSQEIKRAKRA